MANVKQGNLTKAREWWQHLRSFGKREFWKGERQAWKAGIAERIEDDYTHEELMADICTPDEPCELCKRAAERMKADST